MRFQLFRRRLHAPFAGLALLALGWIPFAHAQSQVIQLLQGGGSGAFLGIQMQDVDAESAAKYKLSQERGVIVRSVEKGSPAEEAKLQSDDVILRFEGIEILSSTQLARIVSETPPGRRVDLVISRDGKSLNLSAKLERKPEPDLWGRHMESIPPRSDRGGDRQSPEPLYRFGGPDGRAPFGLWLPAPDRHGQPRLGIVVQPLTDQMAKFLGVPDKKGALVTSVMEGQPAADKVKAGDVIIEAGGRTVETPEDLIEAVRRNDQGTINLKIVRDKKEMSVAVDLSQGEATPGRGYKL